MEQWPNIRNLSQKLYARQLAFSSLAIRAAAEFSASHNERPRFSRGFLLNTPPCIDQVIDALVLSEASGEHHQHSERGPAEACSRFQPLSCGGRREPATVD